MIEKFLEFIKNNNLPLPDDNFNLLLAVSGGVDSVVMCDIFHKTGYKFSITHANFLLRGNDSYLDQEFVENLASKYNVKCFSKKFNTAEYAKNNGISIQMAARELRFKWFYDLCDEFSFQYVATAHHLDDQIETFLINLLRGSNLNALGGIKVISGKIIHPMLFTYKTEILKYAKNNNLTFREDATNNSLKYLRNKIRKQLLPTMKEIYPETENSILSSTQKISEAVEFIDNIIVKTKPKLIKQYNDYLEIDTNKLKKLSPVKLYLFEFIKIYGFKYNIIDNILTTIYNKNSGKKFLSTTHCLVIDRDKIIITELKKKNDLADNDEIIINNGDLNILHPIKLNITYLERKNDFIIPTDSNIACLDYEKLKFPLKIRKWQNGDKFFPLGMKKSQKISDFLINNKIPVTFKNNIYLFCSNDNNIVWLIGMRIDDRYKITDSTKKICIFQKY